MTRRVVIVGGGIAGLTVAERLTALVDPGAVTVELREATDRVGGKLKTTPFAGRPAVDEGADAFLARVPAGVALANRVGLGDELTSPTAATAAVWHERLHPIPEGLLLGVPGAITGLATSGLLSVRGKLRAALEPVLPRTRGIGDSIGRLVRARFGNEVHERLVDALVGSIYAANTDAFSLAMVPQLADLATHRSLLLGARSTQRNRPAANGPLFYAPSDGMETLATATRVAAQTAGATISTGAPVATIAHDGTAWRVDGDPADVVVLATPAAPTSSLVAHAEPDLAAVLAAMDHAGVIIITMVVEDWPDRLRSRSGYLVPKPDQGLVTAASFGSQKWAHWSGDGEIVRVSLGRDGLDVMGRSDDDLVNSAVTEVGHHVGLDLQPTAVRVSRWPLAFPQYRPGHQRWLTAVGAATPPGLFLTGASYRGIGVPACIADAERVASAVATFITT
ncbi:MAG: protoporphyrinogen oxidase [Actinomycetota bacterium]|nr:protoporphyrinogen oxidase [Actinomycetota bacterium]